MSCNEIALFVNHESSSGNRGIAMNMNTHCLYLPESHNAVAREVRFDVLGAPAFRA